MNVVAHIIGLDDIHKRKILSQLPPSLKIIDLDNMQQKIHNCRAITDIKNDWATCTQKILLLRKKDKNIDKLVLERKQIRKNMYEIWKNLMGTKIANLMFEYNNDSVVIVGFNIHSKDYRVKIPLPIKDGYTHKFIYNLESSTYASNQIKYYLATYSQRIINGTFPINLLKHDYVSTKHQRLLNLYLKQDYVLIDETSLKQLSDVKYVNLISKYVYVPLLYKSGDTIIADSNKPITGYETIEDAKQVKTVKNQPIYIYTVPANQFELLNGQFISKKTLYPENETSYLLS